MNKILIGLLSFCFTWMVIPPVTVVIGQAQIDNHVPPGTKSGVPSVISDADQTKIRKMQLDDARISNAIQTRQLEIVQLQQQRDKNAGDYQKFVSGVCSGDFVFSQENDVLSCIQKPKDKEKK